MSAHQNFWFSFSDYLLAEAGGVPLDALHWDAEAICHAFDRLEKIAARLGGSAAQASSADVCLSAHRRAQHVSRLSAQFRAQAGTTAREGRHKLTACGEPEGLSAVRSDPEEVAVARDVQAPAAGGVGRHRAFVRRPGHHGDAVVWPGLPDLAVRRSRPRAQAAGLLRSQLAELFGRHESALGRAPGAGSRRHSRRFRRHVPAGCVPGVRRSLLGISSTGNASDRALAAAANSFTPVTCRSCPGLKIGQFDPGGDQYLEPELLRDKYQSRSC